MVSRVHYGTCGDYVVEAQTRDNEFYEWRVIQGVEFVTHRLFVGDGGVSPASLIAVARHRLEHTSGNSEVVVGLLKQAEELLGG